MSSRRFPALALALATVVFAADELDQTLAALRDGHVEEAIATLRGLIAREPASVRPNYLLSEVLLDAERVAEADEVIRKAVALAPEAADLHQAQGDIDFRRGDIPQAEKDYKAAYRLDPKHARAIYGIARVFQCACLNQKAAALFRQAHDLDPHDADIVGSFAHFSARDDEEIAALQKYLDSARGEDRRRRQALQARIELRRFLKGRQPWDLASPYGSAMAPLSNLMDGPRRLRGFGLSVAVNGARPSTLMLDTGASGLVINRRLAERAGVQKIAELDLKGIGDNPDPTGYLAFAERVAVGGMEFRNCILHVSDKKSVADSDGLIGTNVFERFLVTIDFRGDQLRLNPLPGPPWDGHAPMDRYVGPELKSFAQFYQFGHKILVPTRISEGASVFFLVDTGSSFNMMSPDAANGITKARSNEHTRVRGISGNVKSVYSLDKVQLEFAGFRQTNLDLISFNLSGISRGAGTEVTGIMGLPVLTLFTLTIDYRDGMIQFDYKPR